MNQGHVPWLLKQWLSALWCRGLEQKQKPEHPLPSSCTQTPAAGQSIKVTMCDRQQQKTSVSEWHKKHKQKVYRLPFLTILLRARHEDHIVDLAKRAHHLSNFLFCGVFWDARHINQTPCNSWVLAGCSFNLLLGWWWFDRLETITSLTACSTIQQHLSI